MYKSEHIWYNVSREELEKAIYLCGNFHYKLKSKIFKDYYINSYFQDNILLEKLRKIHFSEEKSNVSSITPIANLYINSKNDKNFLQEKGMPYPSINNKFVCLYSSTNNTALIIGGSIYGLVKSLIYGVGTYNTLRDGYFPVHGLAIKIKNQGILFVGGNKSGKSTLLLELYKKYNDISVATDDWSVINLKNNNVVCQGVDTFFSYKNNLSNDINHPKKYIPLKEFKNAKYLNKEFIINKIFFLDINEKKVSIETINSDIASKILVEASYHSPWGCNKNLETEEQELQNILSHLQVKLFYSYTNNILNFNEILETLTNDLNLPKI